MPGGGRSPEGDADTVSGTGAQVQQSQAPHQRVPAEVSEGIVGIEISRVGTE